LGGTGGCASCRAVSSVSGWVGGSGEGGQERGEVGIFGDGGVAVDSDETIVVALFGVLVDETAGVDACHFSVVESGHFFEFAYIGVATILGQAGKLLAEFDIELVASAYKMGIP
jgi:hypothetical protein